jgi:hypothetical protein
VDRLKDLEVGHLGEDIPRFHRREEGLHNKEKRFVAVDENEFVLSSLTNVK